MNSITVVMILRVYAMWNRSKRILWVLLAIYVPQVISSFVLSGLYNTPNSSTGFTGKSRPKPHAPLKSHRVEIKMSPATVFTSHNCPSYGPLFLQYLMGQCPITA